MFQFIGYDAFSGFGALNPAPTEMNSITKTQLSNAIFDHFNITKDINIPFGTDKPSGWDYDTILDADLNGDLDAGNVDFLIEQISAIKIKRREKGTFDWITLESIPVEKVEDLTFAFVDRLNASDVEYEYAFVPVLEDIEGNYIINSILSKFNGVFIGDFDSIFKFLYEVDFPNNPRNQQIGTFNPLGKQFPVVVSNGLQSYESGSVQATILNDDFDKTGIVDKKEIINKIKQLKDFLTNRKVKCLKTWHGQIWMIMLTSNVSTSYKDGSGMAIPSISFDWVEVGEFNQQDMYNNGLINEVT